MYAGGWVVPKNPVGTGRCTGCERIDRPNHAFGLDFLVEIRRAMLIR